MANSYVLPWSAVAAESSGGEGGGSTCGGKRDFVSAMADEKPGAPNEEPKHLFETFRTRALASVPALSILTFVIVAVKVFRASGMETSTTVAIVSTADVIALLKGVVLTLLPGFLAAASGSGLERFRSRRTRKGRSEPY